MNLTDPKFGATNDTLMQIARMNEEKNNREFLRSDARQRLAAADAARVAGVIKGDQDAKVKRGSFSTGMNPTGVYDPAWMDPDEFAGGRRLVPKPEEPDEKAVKGKSVAAALKELGAYMESPDAAKLATLPPDRRNAYLYGVLSHRMTDPKNPPAYREEDILDAVNAWADMAGKGARNSSDPDPDEAADMDAINAADTEDALIGVDYKSKKGMAAGLSKARELRAQRTGREDKERREKDAAAREEARKEGEARGDFSKLLSIVKSQISQVSRKIAENMERHGVTGVEKPKDPGLDHRLREERAGLEKELAEAKEKVIVTADPRLSELEDKILNGTASPEEMDEYQTLKGK